MRTTVRCLAILAILLLSALPALADEMVSVKAGYQVLTPKGDFAVTSNGGTPDKINLENDLGFDDSKDLTAEVALQLGDWRLAAGYLPIKFSGNGKLTRSIDFNGTTFQADTLATSDVDLKVYEGSLGYYVLNFDDLPVRLQVAPELSVKVVDAKLSLKGTYTPTPPATPVQYSEEKSATVPIPTLGARVRIGLADFLSVVARGGYMKYQDNSFTDLDGQLEFSPIPMIGVYGGYRYFDVKVDESDVFVDAQFSGPYVGAFVRF